MYNLKEYLDGLEQFAPLSLSQKMIDKGHYDNSGIIVANSNCVQKVLFSLDLTMESVNKAIELGCDTIVTHHPAIYLPIKQLDIEGDNKALLKAVKNGLNVISMHLNLDITKRGIDYQLALSTGGNIVCNIEEVDGDCGYGKLVEVVEQEIEDFAKKLQKNLNTNKAIVYGSGKINKVASFCGAGASSAVCVLKNIALDFDAVITSDIPHHNLLELLESGKKVVLIPHYVAENYGFEKFYEYACEKFKNAQSYYFTDKRFM